MSLLGGLRNCLAFLTIIPVGMDNDGVLQAAKYMPLFPVIGAAIGFLAGALVWALDPILPSLVVGMLGLGFILLITGVHHTDGLLDFGDGVMFHGSPEEKLRVMRDPQTGAGGLSIGLVVLLGTAFSIAELSPIIVVQSLTASETAAKFSMVFQAWAGKSAHEGLNTPFIDAMHGKRGHIRLATAFILFIAVLTTALQITVALSVIFSVLITAAATLLIAHRHFGGITGDVLGATNDLSRLVSLLAVLVMINWA